MQLFRFMSREEFLKLNNHEQLVNKKEHNGRTNSVGFCFMKGGKAEAQEAYEYLAGVVSDDICVIFDTEKELKKTWGVYADPNGGFFDTITRDEYCITEYDDSDFRILWCGTFKDFWNMTWTRNITRATEIINKRALISHENKINEEKQERAREFVNEKREVELAQMLSELSSCGENTYIVVGDKKAKIRPKSISYDMENIGILQKPRITINMDLDL